MVFGRKLSRSRKSRRALFRNLVTAIVANGKIVTTKAKAKAVVPMIDKLINLAKKNTVAARRDVFAKLGNQRITTDRIFSIAPSFSKKTGGYLILTPLNTRLGDSSEMTRMEWSETIVIAPKVEKVKAAKKSVQKKAASTVKVTKEVKKIVKKETTKRNVSK